VSQEATPHQNGCQNVSATKKQYQIWENVLTHQLIMICSGVTMLHAWLPVISQDERIYILVLLKKGTLMEQREKTVPK
jgi:hypothetical protein